MTCYDCTNINRNLEVTFCSKTGKKIQDGHGEGDCTICDKFRQDSPTVKTQVIDTSFINYYNDKLF